MNADEKICPECAETIKAAAKVCKHCGGRFKEKPAWQRSPSQGPKNDKERKVAKNSQIGCAVGVIGLVLVISFCSPDTPERSISTKPSDMDTDTVATSADPFADPSKQSLWIIKSQDAIRGRLRDPDSAEFRETRFYSGGSTPVVCGEVNSKNGLGGYTGYQRFIASGDNQSIAFLASDVEAGDSINVAWNELCVKTESDEAYVP